MRIVRNENPLKNYLVLTSTEKRLLEAKLAVEYLIEETDTIYLLLQNNFNDKAKETARKNSLLIDGCDNIFIKRYENFFKYLKDSHAGDCISVPCTCVKCYVESLINGDSIAIKGVDTKFSLYYIYLAFKETNKLNNAINFLTKLEPSGSNKEQNAILIKKSLDYLIIHKEKYFNN